MLLNTNYTCNTDWCHQVLVDVGHWILTNEEISCKRRSQSLSDHCKKLDHRYWTNKGLLVKD
jgi:hypothetical protein